MRCGWPGLWSGGGLGLGRARALAIEWPSSGSGG